MFLFCYTISVTSAEKNVREARKEERYLMKKPIFKRTVICIVILAVLVSSTLLLFGCKNEESPYRKVSDLVFIKINNYMAEWEHDLYNFTYRGSSALTVTVPYTKVLSVTDIAASPYANAELYLDEKRTVPVEDAERIPVDGALTIYIRVQNELRARQHTDYEVQVTVAEPVFVAEGFSQPDENPGGHIFFPDGMETVTLEEKGHAVISLGIERGEREFVIIRTTKEFLAIGKDTSKNYILANALVFSKNDFETIGDETNQIEGIVDGNNYSVTINQNITTIFSHVARVGMIKNMQAKTEKKSLKISYVFAAMCRGLVVNCSNYININIAGKGGTIAGVLGGDIDILEADVSPMSRAIQCINYGAILNSGEDTVASGISAKGRTLYCYNLGDIEGYGGAAGISSYGKQRHRLDANLGEIRTKTLAGGVLSHGNATVECSANYGQLVDLREKNARDYGKEVGGIAGSIEKHYHESYCKTVKQVKL